MKGRVGIIGAMEEEVALFKQELEQSEEIHKAGIRFHVGWLGKHEVVICRCGVGKVNAAVCTQILIDDFHIGSVIFTGVAGALHPSLEIGDIVISNECLQHDIDASALGFARGEIPFSGLAVFKADPRLVMLAEQSGTEFTRVRVMKGRILSGDQFIADRKQVEWLHSQFSGCCTEMEGAAVAQACCLNDIPFVIIRSMSDKADGSAEVNFSEFTIKASAHSHRIVMGMLKRL